MKAIGKKLSENGMQTVVNGVMDGTHIGAIIATIVYGAILAAKCMFSGVSSLVLNWLEDVSWNNILTLVMFLITVVAYWVFCSVSHDWRNYIDRQLDSAELIASEVHFYRENRVQLMLKARREGEQGLRPERHFGRERKIYRIIRYSVILLLMVSALALSADGLLALKLALTFMVSGVAVFATKCHEQILVEGKTH